MKTIRSCLGFAAVTALSALGFAQSSSDSAPLSPRAAFVRLERVDGELTRAGEQLSRVAGRGVQVPPDPCRSLPVDPCLPPGPCREPVQSFACRDVRALRSINGQGEGFLALVDAIDHATDESGLLRRLERAESGFAWGALRVEGLSADWLESPPDPCGPVVTQALQVLASSAEAAELAAGRMDRCSEPASVDRHLGHIVASLDLAIVRMVDIGLQPPPDPDRPVLSAPPDPERPVLSSPPDPERDAKLDAIIARAEAIARAARSLKSGL